MTEDERVDERWLSLLEVSEEIRQAWQRAEVQMAHTGKGCYIDTGLTVRFATAIEYARETLDE